MNDRLEDMEKREKSDKKLRDIESLRGKAESMGRRRYLKR